MTTMRLISAVALTCLAGLAHADSWAVTGVSSDDMLNVRTGPGTSFAVADQLAPGERGLRKEVCVLLKPSPDAPAAVNLPEWCSITRGGQSLGWVSARYLAKETWSEDLPILGGVDGYSGCWYVGETSATIQYLDDTMRLIGCFPGSDGSLRVGGAPLARVAGLDLYSIPG